MATAALSSLFIRTIHPGQFSPIHILSVVTLLALPWGIYAIRTGRVQRHRWTMIGLFTGGLVLAGIRSEEHTSELQSLMRISYAVFCLQKNTHTITPKINSVINNRNTKTYNRTK